MHSRIQGRDAYSASLSLSLDTLHLVYVGLYSIDCSSSVRLQYFRNTTIPRDQVLIEAPSIAIWNRQKVVVAVAISVWGIDVAFLIQGEVSSPLSCG
jgi:hypothetical protein